jgi:hypothetical protein
MPILRTQVMLSRRGALLIRELERGTAFQAARSQAGVSWWEPFDWCLRGRPWFGHGPFAATDAHSKFLLALAATRRQTGCDLGVILNRLVHPFEYFAGSEPPPVTGEPTRPKSLLHARALVAAQGSSDFEMVAEQPAVAD